MTLRILHLSDVSRATGYSRKTIDLHLARDEAEGTPGKRFPVPLRPPARGAKREWHAPDIADWIQARKV